MSAYVVCKTTFRDRASLVAALKDLGFTVEVYDRDELLNGYEKNDVRKASIIVRKRRLDDKYMLSNLYMLSDFGFTKNGDGKYSLIASDYDATDIHDGFGCICLKQQNKLKARYAYHQIVKEARAKGYSVASEKSAGGKTKLVLRRNI